MPAHKARVKISVTLPSELVQAIDRVAPNRSAFLERVAEQYLTRIAKAESDARELAIINKNARRLNRQVRETLKYQIPID